MIISTNPLLHGHGDQAEDWWITPPDEDPGPRPTPIEAERELLTVTPTAAAKLIRRDNPEPWMHGARYECLGLYRFPCEEFRGLEWPGMVVRVYREREHEDGRRTLMAQAYAVVSCNTAGAQFVTWIARPPDERRRWAERKP